MSNLNTPPRYDVNRANVMFVYDRRDTVVLVVHVGKTNEVIGAIMRTGIMGGIPTDDADLVMFGYAGEMNDILPNGKIPLDLLDAVPRDTYRTVKSSLIAFFRD